MLNLPVDDLPFAFELVETCAEGSKPADSESSLCFEVTSLASGVGGASSASAAVTVRGTSGPDLAYGAAWYLRTYCAMSFSWERAGGNQVAFAQAVADGAATWPAVDPADPKRLRWRRRDVSYGFNVCTFSYSQAWYQFSGGAEGYGASWESTLDWMALSGINLALAYTGQEEVYRKMYNGFGVSDEDFAAWSNGPAHLTWSRGQSMHGVGGPLPASWMEQQWHLQKQILGRMRALGMVPVLPAFQGNVPPLLAELYPDANITVQDAHWGGGTAAWLDSTDPLFQEIGDSLVASIIADFGVDTDGDGVGDATEHWYEADGYFAAGDPPWRRRLGTDIGGSGGGEGGNGGDDGGGGGGEGFDENAYAHAAAAYSAMAATDPEARWLYQGWCWNNFLAQGSYTHAQLQLIMAGYAAAAPAGRLLVSDMWSEWAPIAEDLAAVGLPYLYGTLQNFGGNSILGASTQLLADGAPEDPVGVPGVAGAFSRFAGGTGVGAFPEGIDQVRAACVRGVGSYFLILKSLSSFL